MKIRLTHIDGKLPNLALMKLSHFHKGQGDSVYLERGLGNLPGIEPEYDKVYGSAIFSKGNDLARFMAYWPDAVIGGTGTSSTKTVEEEIGRTEYEYHDYGIYPDYPFSIGFTQRGCRLRCEFCVVPQKEGRAHSVNTIENIWRGGEHEKKLVLLDNDFFGQPKDKWKARMEEIIDGGFKVSLNQGINARLLSEEQAQTLASIPYYDANFKSRRIYTAWDNVDDERVFFRGIDRLLAAGVKPYHIMVYVLMGFAPNETNEDRFYRLNKLWDRGLMPYPMVYNNKDKEAKRIQKWVVGRYYRVCTYKEFHSTSRRYGGKYWDDKAKEAGQSSFL